jgi:hypothetical protein
MEQRRVDHAEDRGRRADAKGYRQDGHEGESGRLAQHAHRIADVVPQSVPPEEAVRLEEALSRPVMFPKARCAAARAALALSPSFWSRSISS